MPLHTPKLGTIPDSELGDWSAESPYEVRLATARHSMTLLNLDAVQAAEAFGVRVEDLPVRKAEGSDAEN